MKLSEQILSQETVKKEHIPVPEWNKAGENLFLHELNAKQRDQYGFDASNDSTEFAKGFSVRIIIDTLHDKEGQPVFEKSEHESLSKQSGTLLSRIAEAAQKLSGLAEDSMDEAEKNSESDQSENTYFS